VRTRDRVPRERPADGYHVVQAGEWISKIAAHYGFADWKRIWEAPQNQQLRESRKEPNVIYPGDRVFIPELEKKWVQRETDRRHRFRLKFWKKKLKLCLRDWEGEPRRDEPCQVSIDGEKVPEVVKTDGEGRIEFDIPEGAEEGELVVGKDRSEVYRLMIGHLDPISTVRGYQQRLANLGHDPGKVDGIDGPLTKKGVRSFQEWVNGMAGKQVLVVDGIMGPKTKAKLLELHGY